MSRSSAAIQLARSTRAWRTLWVFILALCGLVYGLSFLISIRSEAKSAQELDLLQADQIASLNPGDPVWVVGRIDSLEIKEEKDEQYWSEDEPDGLVPLRARGFQAQLILDPEPSLKADFDSLGADATHSWQFFWNDKISAIGEVESLEPLTIRSANHVAALPEQHWHWLHSEYVKWLYWTTIMGLVALVWLFWAFTHFSDPFGGTALARKRNLNYARPHPWSGGHVWGGLQGREVRLRRASFWQGAFSRTPWARLVVEHPPGLGVAGHSPQSVAAWSGEMAELRDDLMGLGAVIESRSGSVWLTWPCLDESVTEEITEWALQLAVGIEQLEADAWRGAAERLGLELHLGETEWVLKTLGTGSSELRFGPVDGAALGWQSTFTSKELQQGVQDQRLSLGLLGWKISRRGEQAGQRTDDPILDSHLCFEGFEDQDLQRLVDAPGATEILMSAVAGHGLCLTEGAIVLERVPFVRAPGTLFDDSRALRELLEQAARTGSERGR